jgi:SPX domain protein involved in polyphosphate accumulation
MNVMVIEVFNRYENKYMLGQDILERVQGRLAEYMELDEYNKQHETYTISNLYYDTPDNHLIRTSLQKPKYKEKLRLRAYGIPNENTKVYVEIKKKFRGLVNKRRSAMQLAEAYEFLQTGIIPDEKPCQNRQVLREIAYILESHDLNPALYIAYDRKAFFGVGQHDLRISFDTNIRTRRFDLSLEAGDYGKLLLPQEQWLMEIKSSQSIPVWLSKMLSEYKIYPKSFSKYGAEYKQMLELNKPQVIYTFIPEKAISFFRPTVTA